MAKHLVMHSVFNKDGKNVIMSLYDWGASTFTGEELEKFNEAYEYWEYTQSLLPALGLVKIELITEVITKEDGEQEEIEVGVKSEFPTNCVEQLNLYDTFDTELLIPLAINQYYDKMGQDPNIVVFNRLIRTE